MGRERSLWSNTTTVWLQIGVAYALLQITLWTRDRGSGTIWAILAAAYVLVFTLTGKFTAREMGMGRPSLAGSVWVISLGVPLAASIPLLAALLGENTPPTHALPFDTAWKYIIWSFVQQFMLQSFFFLRLESLLGGRRAVVTAAFLFAAAHIPNFVLTVLCLFGGLFFCEMFRRFRNILPLGLVHAMFGLIIAASFSDAVLHHMRVGIGYVMFRS